MYSVANPPDLVSVLSELATLLQQQPARVDQVLQQMAQHRVIDTFQPSSTLSDTVSNASVIEFADWAMVDGASESWDRLNTRVIKPLGKRDLQFIFHLGDLSKKQVFEVDEVLDIIGDYSWSGKVTLILDSVEADQLWCRLNGKDTATFTLGSGTPAPGARYGSLFKTMRIDSLIVLFPTLVTHFSRAGLLDVGRHSSDGAQEKANGRRPFSIGYQLGLVLKLDALSSTVLGLALSGGYPGPIFTTPSSLHLFEFIQNWLTVLQSKDRS